mgnify:CR=1 FL=1
MGRSDSRSPVAELQAQSQYTTVEAPSGPLYRSGNPIQPEAAAIETATCVGPEGAHENVLELLRPGSFVQLRNHPEDLPPFQLITCRGGRCWVRQQAWGRGVQWEVAHQRLTAAQPTHGSCEGRHG